MADGWMDGFNRVDLSIVLHGNHETGIHGVKEEILEFILLLNKWSFMCMKQSQRTNNALKNVLLDLEMY